MLLVMLGGAIGTSARYGLSKWINGHPWAQTFPYATMIINVSGSFLLAGVAVLLPRWLGPLSAEAQGLSLLLGTGFCGGYTTFSTFEWETFQLADNGSWGLALVNVVASILAGFVGVLLAVTLVNGLFPRE
jgi:CrcB protein